MKFSSAALALAISGSATAGGADVVNSVLAQIADDLKSFDTAITGWTSGPTDQIDAASKKIQIDTEGGAQKISAGESLSLVDAAGITANAQGLQTQLDTTLNDLMSIGEKLAAAGQCSSIQSQLKSHATVAQGLQDAIANKAPPEAKPIAQQLGGKIGATIKNTQSYFEKTCVGAPSAPSSGASGSSPKSSTSGSGSGSGAGTGATGGPGSSGSGSGSGSGGHGAGGHGTASGPSKPATTTAVPKPATYTGAGSTVNVPFAVALALAVFAL